MFTGGVFANARTAFAQGTVRLIIAVCNVFVLTVTGFVGVCQILKKLSIVFFRAIMSASTIAKFGIPAVIASEVGS